MFGKQYVCFGRQITLIYSGEEGTVITAHISFQAALKVAAQTYGGRGEEIQALRMEAEVLRTCMFVLIQCSFPWSHPS